MTDWLDEVREHVDEWNSTMLVRRDVPRLIGEVVRLREALTAAQIETKRVRVAVGDMARFLDPTKADEVDIETCVVIAECVHERAASDGQAEK